MRLSNILSTTVHIRFAAAFCFSVGIECPELAMFRSLNIIEKA